MNIFADLELAQRLERLEGSACLSFVEARARIHPDAKACWTKVAGAYAMFDEPTSPITQTFGLGMFEPATPSALDELEHFFLSRGATVNHEVSPLAGVELYALLANRGYRPIELTSILYREPANHLSGSVNANIRVRIVSTDEYRLWSDVSARGWASDNQELMDFLSGYGSVLAEKHDSVNFLAELDGLPIAAGSLSLSDGAALLAGASTIPEGRRHGAQFALLDARLRYAADHCCDLAMMGAAPGSTSQRNAERNGFKIAYTRVKWQLHPRTGTARTAP